MVRFASTISVIATISALAPARATRLISRQNTTAVHLAVSPNCGSLSGSPADVNAGLDLSNITTIVAFGDSYTSGGTFNGTALAPADLDPPNPNAGGRISNGLLWVENLASYANATLEDWAVNGSVVDSTMYPNITFAEDQPDFLTQVQNYITNATVPLADVNNTLYAVFMGMGDYELRDDLEGGASSLTTVASSIVFAIMELNSSPIFANNFLVIDNYGRGTNSTEGEAYKQELFTQLNDFYVKEGINVAFVDLSTVWDGVLDGTPGYEEFGYTDDGACLANDLTTDGECADPDTTFYWVPGTPSAATHVIMADYVEEVLTQCVA